MAGEISPWRAFSAEAGDWYSAEELARAEAYARPVRWAGRLDALAGAAVMLALIGLHVPVKVVDAVGGPWVVQALVAVALASVVSVVVSIPVSAWRELGYDKRWEFSNQTLGGFLSDLAKVIPLSIVVNGALFVALWAVVRATPLWWLWGWLVFAVFMVGFGLLYPVVIAPIFNKYTPLEEGALRTAIFDVAKRIDADISDVLVEDSSKRDTRSNAYVAGLGKTRRVVVFDTMLDKPHSQLLSVVAHELGHWKLHHIRRTIPLVVALSFLNFVVLKLLLSWSFVLRFAGVSSYRDPALLPLFILAFPVASAATGLASSWLSRAHERQADLFALETTRDAGSFVDTFADLSRSNLMELQPSWWRRLKRSHPLPAERMAMGRAWGASAVGVADR
jgi:STE24 endopeptidase